MIVARGDRLPGGSSTICGAGDAASMSPSLEASSSPPASIALQSPISPGIPPSACALGVPIVPSSPRARPPVAFEGAALAIDARPTDGCEDTGAGHDASTAKALAATNDADCR